MPISFGYLSLSIVVFLSIERSMPRLLHKILLILKVLVVFGNHRFDICRYMELTAGPRSAAQRFLGFFRADQPSKQTCVEISGACFMGIGLLRTCK